MGPLTLAAVCAWRRDRLFGCLGGGVRVLAGEPSACWNLVLWVVPSCCFRWPVVGPHSFMAKCCDDDMTKSSFLGGSSSDSCFPRARQSALIACLTGQRGVCTLCTPLCTGGFATRILIPSSWFCLHYFMKFSVSGDTILRLRSSDSVDVPSSAGMSRGSTCAWHPIRRQSGGVWDPDPATHILVSQLRAN